MQQGQHSMHMAAVVLLLVNAQVMHSKRKGLTKHELALATDVINEGRALMLVVNKLDACTEAEGAQVRQQILLLHFTASCSLPYMSLLLQHEACIDAQSMEG